MKTLMYAFVILIVAVIAEPVFAKGCIKGAIIGGIAGHYAHYHAILGAVAGCLIGRHEAKKHAQAQKAVSASAGQTSK